MSPKLWLVLSLAAVATPGCKCGQDKLKPEDCRGLTGVEVGKDSVCGANSECGDHYACSAPKDRPDLQCCVFADRKCVTEADCCPGQTCPAGRKECLDKFIECTTNADCGEKGDRVCEAYTDNYGTSQRCKFKECGPLGACPEGQACFQNQCMADLPCNGTCEPGKGCVTDLGRCQDYASPTGRPAAACPMTCNAGFIATFKDPKNIWDSCDLPAVACVCGELPGLKSEDLGRYSAMAAQPGKGLFISQYDGQYGDLVVARYDLNGVKLGLDYIDGIPQSPAKFGPSGARGGVVEPGDDVGRYTDIATGSGLVYVSYFDVTRGDLRVAVRDAEGTWTHHKVDGDGADLGLYSSIAVDADGLPGVSYFQRGAEATFNIADCPAPTPTGPKAFITALKYAHANVVVPSKAADWTVKTLSCQSRPPPPCYSCAASDTCGDPGTGPDCYTPSTTCTGCDANTEICVTVGTGPKCAKKYNPSNLSDIPDGVGLFSSLAYKGKEAYVAFMKRTTPAAMGGTRFNPDGDLCGIRISATGTPGVLVRLDTVGDTGYFPDVKINPATNFVAVGYHDFTSKRLKYYTAAQFQAGVVTETIDTGSGAISAGESDWVGTDSSLIFNGGTVYAVYQDATKGDLKLAKRGTTWQVMPSIRTAGAVGFFADGVLIDGKMFASHAHLHARLIAGEPHVDNTLIVEPVPGN